MPEIKLYQMRIFPKRLINGIFEQEVKPKMIEKVQSGKSFSLLEIGDGDIIRFQKVVTVTSYGVVVGAGADLALGDGYELGEAKRLLGSGG